MRTIYKDLGVITILILVGVLIAFAMEFTLPNQPLAAGNCSPNWIAKDENSPFEYNGDIPVCRAIIKTGSPVQGEACIGFSFPPANQQNTCYKVTGLGSTSVKVSKIGGDECKDISHVEFLACKEPTQTEVIPSDTPTEFPPTSTSTQENPTLTPTATEKNPTPSASPSSSQTSTPTLPSNTPTYPPPSTPGTLPPPGTPVFTLTPTSTSISTSTPGKWTPVPAKELPKTGFAEDLLLGVSLAFLCVAVIVIARIFRRLT